MQKKRFLECYISNIHNTKDLRCLSLQKIVHHLIICDNHKDWKSCFTPNCAIRNIIRLNIWIIEYYESSTTNFYKDVENINDANFGNCRNKLCDYLFLLKNIPDKTIQASLQPRSYGKIQDFQVLENSIYINNPIPNTTQWISKTFADLFFKRDWNLNIVETW